MPHHRWTSPVAALIAAILTVAPLLVQPSFAQEVNADVRALTFATFNAVALPLAGDELANADRGEYVWYGNETDPRGWPSQDSYTRFDWRQLEPSRDAYDFSAIDRELAKAAVRGGRFGFRVMTVDSFQGGALVPDYIVNGSGGFWYQAEAGRPRTFLPDWNNETYLTRYAALMQVLGTRYGADARLGFVDIGGYGNYGEWHVYPFTGAYPGPAGQATISGSNGNRLVDSTVDAFPNRTLLMVTANQAALAHALDRSPLIGLRVDCLGGSPSMFGATDNLAAVSAAQNRWTTAPFVTEWCGNAVPNSGVFQTGDRQVAQFHISMLSSGNYAKPWDRFTQAERDAYAHADKSSGYRLVLDQLTVPIAVIRGDPLVATALWENVNVAPTYRNWTPLLQLRDQANGSVVWQAQSSLDLRTILPTDGTPVSHTDTLQLPQTLASGTYVVSLQVVDPDGISPPMRLGISGRAADGSYPLGTVDLL